MKKLSATGLIITCLLVLGLGFEAYNYWHIRVSYFILDLKTGDMEIQYEGRHFKSQLPESLRKNIESNSMSMAENQRFIKMSPVHSGERITGDGVFFTSFIASGVYFPTNYAWNFKALGLWLQVDPEKFKDRLQQYQAYLLRAHEEDKLPSYYSLPELNYGQNQKAGFLDESNMFDLEEFRRHVEQVLNERIKEPRP